VNETPVLTADSIGKSYGRRRVLSAASLRARAGRITALLGRNGCGKTTLLKIAAGWLRPDYGLIVFAGHRCLHARLAVLARLGLFYLPERSLLHATRTVRQHLAALAHAFPTVSADPAIDTLKLGDLLDRKPATLSGGERRRVELALAVARRPDCLLADEPFRDIAPSDRERVAAALRRMAQSGAAIVATGHEVVELLDVADEVLWMTAGTTHALGPPADARQNFPFMREYLGLAILREEGWRGRSAWNHELDPPPS
jgi:lipopolysaccharide export system ATP-binding protein